MVISDNNNQTHTIFNKRDIDDLIEENLGNEVLQAMKEYYIPKEEQEEKDNRIVDYIEDGIWWENIEESNIVKDFTQKVIDELREQDFIKKNKNISKFELDENLMIEFIDNKLCGSLMKYFGYCD